MPVPSQYRRSPLMGLALTPLNDSGVKIQSDRIPMLLKLLRERRPTAAQCAYATILGGYEQTPEMPELDELDPLEEPLYYAEDLAAAELISIMSRDTQKVAYVKEKLKLWSEAMEKLPEAEIFLTGSGMLRAVLDFYNRTGYKICLEIAEKYRSYLPDVSSFLSTFPFYSAYVPEEQEKDLEYRERMNRFASHPFETLSICALLCRFTGSRKGFDAVGAGFDALEKYHSLPGGLISCDPYVKGHDPSHSESAIAVAKHMIALCDALQLTGELGYAEKLEALYRNAFTELICENGIKARLTPSRVMDDGVIDPDEDELTALLEAAVALKRCAVCQSEDHTIDILLHLNGEYKVRIDNSLVKLTVSERGFYRRILSVKTDLQEGVKLKLRVRIPEHADGARLRLNELGEQSCPVGQYATIMRTFMPQDELQLLCGYSPRGVYGFRGGIETYCGEILLALPAENTEYRYAICDGEPMRQQVVSGKHCAVVRVVCLPSWSIGRGVVLPAPQNVRRMGEEIEKLLLPAAELGGRVSLLPLAK